MISFAEVTNKPFLCRAGNFQEKPKRRKANMKGDQLYEVKGKTMRN